MKNPPDHGEVSWTFGAETFTRREVEALLHTQRAMIENDIKRNFLLDAFPGLLELLENPRTPEF